MSIIVIFLSFNWKNMIEKVGIENHDFDALKDKVEN